MTGWKDLVQNETIVSQIEIRLRAIYLILYRMMTKTHQWDGTGHDRKVLEMIAHLDPLATQLKPDKDFLPYDVFAIDGRKWPGKFWIRVRHFFRETWPIWVSISSLAVAVAALFRSS